MIFLNIPGARNKIIPSMIMVKERARINKYQRFIILYL